MRIGSRIALILVISSGHAVAAPKTKPAPKRGAHTLNTNDPVEKETSERKVQAAKAEQDQAKAHAEKKEEARLDAVAVEDARARDRMGVFGNVLIGFGKGTEAGPGEVATGRTTSATFIAGGHYDLSPDFTLSLRVPWTVGSARQPDGLQATVQALGSPELRGEYRVALNPFSRIPLFVGLGVPLARGDYDTIDDRSSFRQTQLNEVADAASGYRDGELFGPKRLPLVFGGGFEYERRDLTLRAATKFVAGFKLGGTLRIPDDGVGSYELKSVTFRNVTSAGLAYRFWQRPNLFAALDTWVVYNAINAVEYTSNSGVSGPTRLQFVFEPRLAARFGKISPSVGYIFPIGGRLADNSTSGLELHCDVAF